MDWSKIHEIMGDATPKYKKTVAPREVLGFLIGAGFSAHLEKDGIVTNNADAAKDGKLYVWGENFNELLELPEGIENAKITQVVAGRAHFMALDENGKLYAWGSNKYKQATIPSDLQNEKVRYISAGFYQSYAVTESGKVYGWGNNGFL